MAKPRKFSPEVEREIAADYAAGNTIYGLCHKYATCVPVIRRIIKENNVARPETRIVNATCRNVTEFSKRVKSVLWRQEKGKEHPSYDSWKETVEFLMSDKGAGYTHAQAVVQASKNYPCLGRLFREYDVAEFDPNPESHPVKAGIGGTSMNKSDIVCEGKEQSYRDSLRWAVDAAGAYLRTGQQPARCPCDAAYYLYQQAISEPKDFLSKLGQIESKGVGDSDDDSSAKSSKKSVAELDAMLADLELEVKGE